MLANHAEVALEAGDLLLFVFDFLFQRRNLFVEFVNFYFENFFLFLKVALEVVLLHDDCLVLLDLRHELLLGQLEVVFCLVELLLQFLGLLG